MTSFAKDRYLSFRMTAWLSLYRHTKCTLETVFNKNSDKDK